jgi:hypothetical protein
VQLGTTQLGTMYTHLCIIDGTGSHILLLLQTAMDGASQWQVHVCHSRTPEPNHAEVIPSCCLPTWLFACTAQPINTTVILNNYSDTIHHMP